MVSFSNEMMSEASEKLAEGAERDKLNDQVESIMGSSATSEFKEDGTFSANIPLNGQAQDIMGTWSLAEDKNDTAVLELTFKAGENEMTVSSNVTFKNDDQVHASFEPFGDESTKGIFYLDLRRKK